LKTAAFSQEIIIFDVA